MHFEERWREELPEALARFATLAERVKDIDFTTGILAAGVLWPVREAIQAYEGDAADVVREVTGAGAGKVLKIVNTMPDEPTAAARLLAEQAEVDPELREALLRLIQHFDAAQLFAGQLAELLARRYPAPVAGTTFNISDEIKAALVNIGGVTNINDLTVQLNLPPLPQEPPLSQRQRWVMAGVSVVLLMAALLGIASFVQGLAPTVMPEETFNIAIANFRVVDEQGQRVEAPAGIENQDESIAAFLEEQTDAIRTVIGSSVEVWRPSHRGVPEVGPDEAEEVAASLNADVLIYGIIERQGNDWQLVPAFFVTDEVVEQADELRGGYPLGNQIRLSDRAVFQGETNQTLQARLRAIVYLLRGLTYYSEETFERAAEQFEQSVTDPAWGSAPDPSGQEVLYLFLGNAYLKQTNALASSDSPEAQRQIEQLLDQSEQAYQHALKLNERYARTYNGLGGLLFQKAYLLHLREGDCEGSDTALTEAEAAFRNALTAPQKPRSGYVEMRADLGLGRVFLVRGACMMAVGRNDEARTAYEEAAFRAETVANAFEANPVTPTAGIAALAYDQLAFVSKSLGEREQDEQQQISLCQQAQSYSSRAVELAQQSATLSDDELIHPVACAP